MESIRLQLGRYLKAVWKHRWLALGVAWLICGLGWIGVYFIPNQYEATARIYVDADAVLTPLLRGVAAENPAMSQVDILQRTLLSRPNLQKLISKADLDLTLTSAEDRERLVQRLGSEIKIKPQTKTLFTIEYRNSNPQRAYEVVQTLLTIFVENATGSNRNDMENARRFIDRQISSYEAQLRAAEQRRAEFRARYSKIVPPDEGGGGSSGVSRFDQLRTQVATLTSQLMDATIKRDALRDELGKMPATLTSEVGEAAGGSGHSAGRLHQAEEQLRDLRLRYTEEHPDVVATRKLVESLRASPPAGGGGGRGGIRAKSAPNPTYEQLRLKLVDTEAALASLKRQLEEATKEYDALAKLLSDAPDVLTEFKALDRDYSVLKHQYQELLARREAAHIAQAAETQADQVRLNIVDPPQVPRIPVAPNRIILVAAVLAVGVAGGAGLAVLLSQFDRSFRTISDLRELGLPVLGGVALIEAGVAPRRVMATVGFFGGVLALVIVFSGLMAYILRVQAVV